MRSRDYLLLIAIVLISVIVTVSCDMKLNGGGVGTYSEIESSVDLHVVGNPKRLKVITGPMPGCRAANNRDGCVVVPRTDTAKINFELKTSPNWHFTKMVICKGGTKNTQDCDVDLMDRAQFKARIGTAPGIYPDSKGVIDLTSLSPTLTAFDLHDENIKIQDYFYTLWVCETVANPVPDEPKNCIPTDPPIENGGRH